MYIGPSSIGLKKFGNTVHKRFTGGESTFHGRNRFEKVGQRREAESRSKQVRRGDTANESDPSITLHNEENQGKYSNEAQS